MIVVLYILLFACQKISYYFPINTYYQNKVLTVLGQSMGDIGPSPMVPSMIVVFLSLLIVWPTISSIGGGATILILVLLFPISLTLVVYLLSIFIPLQNLSSATYWENSNTGSVTYDGEGLFGVGTMLLVVLFFLLYSILG